MNRLLIAAIFLTACSGPALPARTTSTTTLTPDTRAAAATTTTLDQRVEIVGCTSPPVTFGTLCEIYDLLKTWYVDRPIDTDELARLALTGLLDFTTEETQDPPRTLFCAVPDQAFAQFCEALGERIETSQIAVGPAVDAAVSHMVDGGLDPFTYYVPPEQVGSVRLSGIVGGIGVVLDARDAVGSKCSRVAANCKLEIVVVLDNNPGSVAGLRIGDVITAVDGKPVGGKGFTAVVSDIAGDETGVVALSVRRGNEPLEFVIERAPLQVPGVEVGLPLGDVGYLRIPDFELDVPQLVDEALTDITSRGAKTIIVDLRDNPGGFISAYTEVVDQFVDGGIIMVSDAPDEHLEYHADPGGVATNQRLVVLVNQGTASAAEILAGTLRDRRDAVVVGTHTFGKDAVQIPFTLRNGGEFFVAVARWSTPQGVSAGHGGLVPDRSVVWPGDATREEIVDIALEAAS